MPNWILTILIIFGGIGLGSLTRYWLDQHGTAIPQLLNKFRRRLNIIGQILLSPIAFILALWVLPLQIHTWLTVPGIALFGVVVGQSLGLASSKLLNLSDPKAAWFGLSYGHANSGNIGGLVLLMLVGETGVALVPFYLAIELLWQHLALYPIVKRRHDHMSQFDFSDSRSKLSPTKLWGDPLWWSTIGSIFIGLVLKATGIRRPTWFELVTNSVMLSSSLLLLFSIGLGIRFYKLRGNWGHLIGLVGIKLLLIPAAILGLIWIVGLWHNDLILRGALVLAAMPTAFLALEQPNDYKLEPGQADAAWLIILISLGLIIPVLTQLI